MGERNFIEEFVYRTRYVVSPVIYRKWTAVSIVASALGRKCFTYIRGDQPVYPNFYILLVGPPGTGKSNAIDRARDVLAQCAVHLTPDRITHEQLYNRIEDAISTEVVGERMETASCLTALLSEFAVFMRGADIDFMQSLARLYDCPKMYEYDTKHNNGNRLEHVFFNILGGVQPAWFAEGFPRNAWDLGLPARLFLIYSDVEEVGPFFEGAPDTDMDALALQVRRIQNVSGEFTWEPAAMEFFDKWRQAGFLPVPEDPLLASYRGRRFLHLAKLAMVIAAACHPGRAVITLADITYAYDLMLEAEKEMPKALSAAGGNIYRIREESILLFVRERWAVTRKAVPEWLVRQHLSRLVPSNLVGNIVDNLVNSKMLDTLGANKSPHRLLRPGRDK